MRANPGGVLTPDEVIGRDELIGQYWDTLRVQSLVLGSVRRLGKTSITKKMAAEPPAGFVTCFRDLEKIHSTLEFAKQVVQDVFAHLGRKKRATRRLKALWESLQGTEVGGVLKLPKGAAEHWKQLLTVAFDDLSAAVDGVFVFFWDEVPMMLDNIRKAEGDRHAEEVLNTLRAVRQTYANIRMVYTGSFGLHCVLSSLKRGGYASSPINDMDRQEVPPLEPADARDLVHQLLEGEQVHATEAETVIDVLIREVDRAPYYIHLVVKDLARSRIDASADRVRRVVHDAITDPLDRWDMKHYRDRLTTYYDESERAIALAMLDALAAPAALLRFDELFDRVKAQVATSDRDLALEVATLLQRDHYILLDGDGTYSFRFPLVARWWRLHRGL